MVAYGHSINVNIVAFYLHIFAIVAFLSWSRRIIWFSIDVRKLKYSCDIQLSG